MKDIISNCFLCGEHSLHVAGKEEAQLMQCINCGYVTSTKYLGTKETNEEFQKLTDDMKRWAKEENNRIWIPTILTLPIGMLYPMDDENKVMKWGFAPMIEITEEEKENYPNDQGGFYERKIDTDNTIIYDEFFEAMLEVNEKMKKNNEQARSIK
jgi:transcription elongation factor Elf1